MSSTEDDRTAPRLSDPTTVESASPFDSTDRNIDLGAGTTSDPPTALVRRESFRELPPGSVVGEIYEIDARLGAGAMGEVYAARHISLGKRVAIKVISQRLSEDDAAIERFAMEARTLAQIQHPAIVAVEHVGELADGRAYFVMEFLRGSSLFERLQLGRIPLPEALRILDQMARGLDAAHGEGVTHRDLKPENTFLVHLPGEPPVVKLVDFGLAKLKRADIDRRAERTQSGVAIGTPMYMSPEQMRGPDVDHRTDIYALGCVAYEMVLGVPPFQHARTAPELYAAHLHEAPPLPRAIWPEIPPQLDLCLFAMLAKDPAHRPTLAQVRAVVSAARTDDPSQRATEFVRPRAPRAGTRKLWIAVIALVGGIAIGVALTSGSKDASQPTLPAPKFEQISTPAAPPPASTTDTSASPPIDTIDKTPRLEATPKSAVQSPSAPSRPATKRRASRGAGVTPTDPTPQPDPTPQSVAVDAGIAETLDLPQRPKPQPPVVNRNQTIDPFKRKVNP